MLAAGHFAAVGIAECNGDAAVGECFGVAAHLIGRADDPLVEDDLAGTVDAAVGDQHDRRVASWLPLRPDVGRVGRDRVWRAIARRGGDDHDLPPLLCPEFISAVGVSRGRAPFDKCLRVAALLANPGRHAGLRHRFT